MSVPRQWWFRACWVLLLAGLLPVVARSLREERSERCKFDGNLINPRHRVRVEELSSASTSFCCLTCAERHLSLRSRDYRELLVTDELTGREIPARDAWFVRSVVIAEPVNGERRHAFATREQAQRHADAHRGRLLSGDERPFAELGNTADASR